MSSIPFLSPNKPELQAVIPLQESDAHLACFCCEASYNDPGNMKMCKACGEATYCDKTCQSVHWKSHEKVCGHDRIELKDFFSFLGKYQDPNNLPVHGISSALISHHNQTFGVWFGSTVANVQVEDKIPHKDNTLWTKIAVCVALLAELYTTTSTPNAVNSINLSPGRTRLTVGVDPIADFGIVAGSDNEPNTTSHKQQEDHDTRVYWIYFKTFRENVWYLDWRVPFLDGAGPCIYPRLEDTSYFSPHASATCNTERNIKTGDYTSVLKDPHMLKALQDGEKSSDLYSKFTKKISGRESSPLEKSLMVPKVEEMRTIMRNHLMTTKSSQQGSGNN